MGYIKKLKNNELVGGTDKTTIYPVTSAEAVFEEVSDNEFKSQKYLNNHITNERIVDNTIENRKLKDDTIDMGKLNTQLKTIIQNAYDASWKVKEEPFSLETKYDANDVVYDPDTNSSYVSLTADNQGNPVNPEDEGYVEGKWRIIINGISAVESTEVINETVGILEDKFDTLEGNVDDAIEGLDNRIDEIQDDLSSLTAYETAVTPSYDTQIPLKNLASTAQVGYYFCTVEGSETVKQVSNAIVSNTAVSQIGAFSLPPSGGHFKVKMSNAHTATSGSVTLRFGNVAATNKPLYYNGEPVSATNSWDAGEVISVYYDGTYYQASNTQSGSNKKINTYLYEDVKSLLVGNTYNVDEAVKTTDKQFRRITKEIKTLSFSETLTTGDIKTSGNATYRVDDDVDIYDPEGDYSEHPYALGSLAEYIFTVTAESITAGNITVNETEIAVEETDNANSIATKIADALVIDGWTTSVADNVVTVRCNTIGNNTTTITIDPYTENTGIAVDESFIAGTNVIRKYDGESWATADVPTMETDGIIISVNEAWLITNATKQNSVTQDIKKDLSNIIIDTRIIDFFPPQNSKTTGTNLNYIWGNKFNVGDTVSGIFWKCHSAANSLSVYKFKSGEVPILIKTYTKDSSWISGEWVQLYFDEDVNVEGYYIGVLGYVYYGTSPIAKPGVRVQPSGNLYRSEDYVMGVYTFYNSKELNIPVKTSKVLDKNGNLLNIPLDEIVTEPSGNNVTLSEDRFDNSTAFADHYISCTTNNEKYTISYNYSRTHGCTGYIDVHDAAKLKINKDISWNLIYFNKDKICCGYYKGSNSGNATTVTPPEGTYYVRMNYEQNNINTYHLYAIYDSPSYNISPRINITPDSISALKPLTGLKVAWYGTSIPNGYPYENTDQNTYSYANRAVRELGGTIKNYCVSGGILISSTNTSSTQNRTSRFTDIDPEGTYYSARNYKSVMLDLIGTEDEPDIFVFDYGANDGMFYASHFASIDLNNIDITSTDITTFVGAYNTVIKSLLTAKPAARIFLVTHYSDDSQFVGASINTDGYKKMNRIIEKIAEYWHIPCNSVYKKTGWIRGRLGISNIKDIWCVDGIHPASSHNIESVRFLTRIHKQFLMENYCY